jgi:hypothetical protein
MHRQTGRSLLIGGYAIGKTGIARFDGTQGSTT